MIRLIACLLLLIEFHLADGQTFFRSSIIEIKDNGIVLQNGWAGGINAPMLSEIDLNMDGIKDLFLFDASNNRIETFINNGTPGVVSYVFNPNYIDSFPTLHDWAFLHDYNCDGKEDIFTYSDIAGSVRVYINTSSPGNLHFTLLTDQLLTLVGGSLLTNLPATKETYPTFDDVDRDGDMDILDWPTSPDASIDYHINQSQQLGYGCDSLIFQQDAPCWGAFTMCLGSNRVCAFNALCKPAPIVSNYFNPSDAAKKDDTITTMLAIDLDGDNDTDLLIGDVGSPNVLAVYNGGTNQVANMISQDTIFPSYNVRVSKHSFVQNAYFDVNNDGRKDLMASARRENFSTSIAMYIDTSSSVAPGFSLSDSVFLQNQMLDFGRMAFPTVFDYNNDGLNDLVIGNEQYAPLWNNSIKTGLALLKNTGTLSHPKFDVIDRNFANINSLGFAVGGAAPAFGDLDGDTDLDMIIGSEDGKLYYYTNTAPIGGIANFTLNQANYFGIDVGNYSIPQIIDLNQDGLNDLVVGRRSGTINYYQNTGTPAVPVFSSSATIDTLGGIILTVPPGVTGYASPFFYNDNGVFKLYVACEKGEVYEYGNINGNLNGNFSLMQTIISKSEGRNLNISVGDLNGDNQPDLVVGNLAGGVTLYFQNVNANSSETILATKLFVNLKPNPANGDFSICGIDLVSRKKITIEIFNSNGQLVKTVSDYKTGERINVKNLQNGIYIVQINEDGFKIFKKLSVIK